MKIGKRRKKFEQGCTEGEGMEREPERDGIVRNLEMMTNPSGMELPETCEGYFSEDIEMEEMDPDCLL